MGGRLGELQNLTKNATVARTRADTTWQSARLALSEAEAGLRLGHRRQIEQRAEHAQRDGDSQHVVDSDSRGRGSGDDRRRGSRLGRWRRRR